jgi:hypothetical protein
MILQPLPGPWKRRNQRTAEGDADGERTLWALMTYNGAVERLEFCFRSILRHSNQCVRSSQVIRISAIVAVGDSQSRAQASEDDQLMTAMVAAVLIRDRMGVLVRGVCRLS